MRLGYSKKEWSPSLLREAPSTTNGYTVTYNVLGGVVTATGLTGCPS